MYMYMYFALCDYHITVARHGTYVDVVTANHFSKRDLIDMVKQYRLVSIMTLMCDGSVVQSAHLMAETICRFVWIHGHVQYVSGCRGTQ